MGVRTDLAMELHEMHRAEQLSGITEEVREQGRMRVSRIRIQSEDAARRMGKPQGEYVTALMPPFQSGAAADPEETQALAGELRRLMEGDPEDGLVLVVGLGNQQITPDAVGPWTAREVLATRHLRSGAAETAGLDALRPVAVVAPGVLGQTGVETGEIVSSLVKSLKPARVIAVDALASRSLDRLGCTIQLADSGISPGSGVANARKELSRETLGVPVLSVGVPTVVDGATLAADLLEGREPEEETRRRVEPRGASMMVTPRGVDLMVQRAARLLAMSLNLALQPALSMEDILCLTQ